MQVGSRAPVSKVRFRSLVVHSLAVCSRISVVSLMHIRVPDAITILAHLRAPAPFIKPFGVFYEQCRRIFVLKGAHDDS